VVDATKWSIPPVFREIQKLGPVAPDEMARTFNMGLGLCVIVPAAEVKKTIDLARAHGFDAWDVGRIEASSESEPDAVVENLS
jgi:phosphoribosylformylglycinamidine cyclo-ligase